MSTSTASVVDNARSDSERDLNLLLDALRGIDLSKDIFDESKHRDGHGGYSDIFKAKSRRHGNIIVAVKHLRLHILHNKDASKVGLFLA